MTDKKKEKPFVFVRCLTYNHEKYIEDALNGFVMQQTNFPFVVAIVDDASTDNNARIIREYLQRVCDFDSIKSTIEEYGKVIDATPLDNPNCLLHIVHLNENHYGKKSKLPYFAKYENAAKYVAMCEGDDYWTDPLKLQKQVDFLETNPEYSMCFHAAKISLEGVDASKTGAKCERLETREYHANEMFSSWIVPTASIVYRRSMYKTKQIKNATWLTRGDIALVLTCADTGRVWGMQEQMSVYRMQPNSVSHNPNIRGKEIFKLPNHFRCLYMNFTRLNKEDITWCISNAYYGRMKRRRNPINFICDFILFFYWNPKYAFHKISTLISRKTK